MPTLNSEAIVASVVRTTFILTALTTELDCSIGIVSSESCPNSSSIPEGIESSSCESSKSILLTVVLVGAYCC